MSDEFDDNKNEHASPAQDITPDQSVSTENPNDGETFDDTSANEQDGGRHAAEPEDAKVSEADPDLPPEGEKPSEADPDLPPEGTKPSEDSDFQAPVNHEEQAEAEEAVAEPEGKPYDPVTDNHYEPAPDVFADPEKVQGGA